MRLPPEPRAQPAAVPGPSSGNPEVKANWNATVLADVGGSTVQSIRILKASNGSVIGIMFSHDGDGFYVKKYNGGYPCNTANWGGNNKIFNDGGAFGISKDYVDFNDDGLEDVAIQSDDKGTRYLLSPAYENITDTWDDTIVNRTKGGRHIAVGNLSGDNKDIISSGKPDGLANATMENNKLSLFIHPDWNETAFTARKPAVEGENLDLKNYSEVIASREGQVGLDDHSFVMILKRNSTSGEYYKYWEDNYTNDYGLSCKLPDPILVHDFNNDGYMDFVIDAQNSENLKLFYSSSDGSTGYTDWKAYKTNTSGINNGSNNTIQFNISHNFTVPVNIVWNIKVTELGGKTAFAPTNYSLFINLSGAGNNAPSATINSPPDNEDYANGTTSVQINGTYSDPDLDIGNLSLINNDTDATVDINDSMLSDTWGILTWAGLSNGTYCYYLLATDNNSATGVSGVRCFVINDSGGGAPPAGTGNWTVILDNPANNSALAGTEWVELRVNVSNLTAGTIDAIFYNDSKGMICNATNQRIIMGNNTFVNASSDMVMGKPINLSIDNNVSSYSKFNKVANGTATWNFSQETITGFNIFSSFLNNCSDFGCIYRIEVFDGTWRVTNDSNVLFNHSNWDTYTFNQSYTNARALRLSINASGANVRIWEINYSSVPSSTEQQYTCNYTGLSAGTYKWFFNLSNSSYSLFSGNWNFTINNSLPEIIINEPDNNSILFSGSSNSTINVTIIDPDGGTMNISIFNETGGLLFNDTDVPSGSDVTYDYTDWADGDHNITVNVTDTGGDITSITWSFTISSKFNIIVHKPLDGAVNVPINTKFNITIYTNGSNVNISIYDNSDTLLYNISGVGNDTDINFTWANRSLGVTYLWYLNMTTEADIISSDMFTFTISSGDIDNCSIYNNTVLTFFLFDEQEPTNKVHSDIDIVLRTDTTNYTFNGRNKTTYSICLAGTSVNINSGWIEYRSEGYETDNYTQRNYYFLTTVLNASSTSTVNLYLLEDTPSTAVLFHTTDAAGADYPDVYGYIQKYYVGEDTYRTVAMIHTDDQADAITYIELLDVWYRFILFQNDTILVSTDPTQVKTDEYYLKISSIIGNYNDYRDIKNLRYNLTFDDTTNITRYEIVSTDGLTTYACLDIVNQKLSGKRTVYSHCEHTSSANIFYNLENETEGGKYMSYASVIEPDGNTHVLKIIEITRQTSTNVFGFEGVLLTALGGGTAAFSGLANPIAPIVLGLITIGSLMAFGFYQVELLAFTSIAIVGGILIYFLRK